MRRQWRRLWVSIVLLILPAVSRSAAPHDATTLYFPLLLVARHANSLPDPAYIYLPTVQVGCAPTYQRLLIHALLYDPFTSGEPDESFELWNPGPCPVDLLGWAASDGTRQVVFPSVVIPPRQTMWCAYSATAFQASFGWRPACEYGPVMDATLPHLGGNPLRFANTGGRLALSTPTGYLMDVVVYETGAATLGWNGPGVAPWHPTGFSEEGQIIYRKLDETTGQPVPDTDRAEDWASDPGDAYRGRKVRFTPWDMTALRPFQTPDSAPVMVALTPDAGYGLMRAALASATRRIQMELYSFDHARLADVLAERGRAGVVTTILLEGAPSGGLKHADRYAAARVAQSGGRVLYMTNAAGGRPRYRSQHAKLIIIDDRVLLLSTENLTPDAMPDDDQSDGTRGRRGLILLTEQPALVRYAQQLFTRDTDLRWRDLVVWNPFDTVYGPPPPGYVPTYESGGAEYAVQFPAPMVATADRFELLQSPENSLRQSDGLIGLLGRAGRGDTILTQQLTEQTWWGTPASNPTQDPNPRLEAMVVAARRGAAVRLHLDSFFDDVGEPRANRAACLYVNGLAVLEGIDIQCRTGNPTGLGIHNKMVLARIGGEGWVHVGSLNGSETSHKLNRELALQFQSTPIYNYLAAAWQWDWDNGR